MPTLEVSRAQLKNLSDSQSEGKHGVYLEIIINMGTRKGFCKHLFKQCLSILCCRRRRKMDFDSSNHRTHVVDEAPVMTWRKKNRDGFHIALFQLGGRGVKFHRGKTVTLAAHVFRGNIFPKFQKDGTKVITLKGSFIVTGQEKMDITLRPADAETPFVRSQTLVPQNPVVTQGGLGRFVTTVKRNDATERFQPCLTLELRRVQLRPFSLENARPRFNAELEQRDQNELRNKRIYKLWNETPSRPTTPPPLFNRNATLGQRVAMLATKRHDVMQKMKTDFWDMRLSAPVSNLKASVLYKTRKTAIDTHDIEQPGEIHTKPRLPSNSTAAKSRRVYSPRFTSLSVTPASGRDNYHLQSHFQHWVVREWSALWKSLWPHNASDLGVDGVSKVIPLMEAEFRKDCIILFNTIYPRVMSKNFLALRDLSLDKDSHIAFPQARHKSDHYERHKKVISSSISKLRARRKMLTKYGTWHAYFYGASSKSLLRSSFDSLRSTVESWVRPTVIGYSHQEDEFPPGRSMESFEAEQPVLQSRSSNRPFDVPSDTKLYTDDTWDKWELPAANKEGRFRRFPPSKSRFPLTVCTESGCFSDEYSARVMFLKRLLICFAACGVKYGEDGQQHHEQWPYPLASLLGHGSRVLIWLRDVPSTEFINFLLIGDQKGWDWSRGPPQPIVQRMVATHAVTVRSGNLIERKLKATNVADTVQNIQDGINNKHYGLDMPIGGAGNPSPLGDHHIISFAGKVVKTRPHLMKMLHKRKPSARNKALLSRSKATMFSDASPEDDWRFEPHYQGGHLYIRIDDFGRLASTRAFEGDQGTDEEIRRQKLNDARRKFNQIPQRHILFVKLVHMRQQCTTRKVVSKAGSLLFPDTVPLILPQESPILLGGTLGIDTGRPHGDMRMFRARSSPALRPDPEYRAEDLQWVYAMLSLPPCERGWTPLHPPPPSVAALKVLLQYFFPLECQLFGCQFKGGEFKGVEDLWTDLQEEDSCLVIRDRTLYRLIEEVIVELDWQGHCLMSRGRAEGVAEKMSFPKLKCSVVETPESAVQRWVAHTLNLNFKNFTAQLVNKNLDEVSFQDDDFLSPEYPGIASLYRTHTVKWEVKQNVDMSVFESTSRAQSPHSRSSEVSLEGILDTPRVSRLKTDSKGSMQSMESMYDESDTDDIFFSVDVEIGDDTDHYFYTGTSTGWPEAWCWLRKSELEKSRDKGVQGLTRESWATYNADKVEGIVLAPDEPSLFLFLQRCGIFLAHWTEMDRAMLWRELVEKEKQIQMFNGCPSIVEYQVVLKIHHLGKVLSLKEWNDSLGEVVRTLPCVTVLRDELLSDAINRCLRKSLGVVGIRQLTNVIADRKMLTHEERQDFDAFPGINGLHRYHLLTIRLRDDAKQNSFLTSKLDISEKGRLRSVKEAMHLRKFTSHGEEQTTKVLSSSRHRVKMARVAEGSEVKPSQAEDHISHRSDFDASLESRICWVPSHDLVREGVEYARLWEGASDTKGARHTYSSVLVGLEGAAPQFQSPFHQKHSSDGKPNVLSALGNRKWEAYRVNSASQIPADINGLQMTITREDFEEFKETVELIDVVDAQLDLLWDQGAPLPQDTLEHRFSERELFKQILGGSVSEAKKAINWMREYRIQHKTPNQIHAAINSTRSVSVPKGAPKHQHHARNAHRHFASLA